MIKEIPVSELKLGMFVTLPDSWLTHGFLENEFLLENSSQIEEIKRVEIETVEINTSRSTVVRALESISHKKEPETEAKASDGKNLPEIMNTADRLKETINDRKVSPEVKAKAVYQDSLVLLKNLLEDPSKQAIIQSKKALSSMVDLILSDDKTSSCILKITQHDFYTYTHSINVGILSVSLSKKLYGKSSKHDMHELGAGFFLHDLGKTRVDPAIINKNGRLTEEEMASMRTHPYQSYKIFHETDQLSEEASIIAMQHHEREDGSGYPKKLKGDEIHEYGRICCIADVYDALTAERSYKKPFTPFQSLKIMKEEMLGHFHKDIFEKFVTLFV